jgi:hypothetical protein
MNIAPPDGGRLSEMYTDIAGTVDGFARIGIRLVRVPYRLD